MTKKEQQYFNYIQEHRKLVTMAWEFFKKLVDLDDVLYVSVDKLISIHDASKFSEQEFGKYRQFFFPEEGEEKSKADFNIGWNHHQKANPHHWQYWIMYKENGISEVLEMPREYIIEMLCDWLAMSVKFKNLPSEWYYKEKSNMFLHYHTWKYIEQFMSKLDMAFGLAVLSYLPEGE